MHYYNEIDPRAAQWLRELMAEGWIPKGTVDERSIVDVRPEDLDEFAQCHFFAGIGGWPLALRLAEWPEDRPAWTGSCPCQPFSCAGKGLGESDERHLWPGFFRLIQQRRPPIIFGEQVASKAALAWIDGVFADLEGENYACGAADLCAAGIGAPHIRQRLFWMADAQGGGFGANGSAPGSAGHVEQLQQTERMAQPQYTLRRTIDGPGKYGCDRQDNRREETYGRIGTCGEVCGMAHAELRRPEQRDPGQRGIQQPDEDGAHGGMDNAAGPRHTPAGPRSDLRGERGRQCVSGEGCYDGGVGHADSSGSPESERGIPGETVLAFSRKAAASGSALSGFWSDAVWHVCTDHKARRISPEPALFPLAHGLPGRVGLLRGAGNAIVAELAAEFVRACQEAKGIR